MELNKNKRIYSKPEGFREYKILEYIYDECINYKYRLQECLLDSSYSSISGVPIEYIIFEDYLHEFFYINNLFQEDLTNESEEEKRIISSKKWKSFSKKWKSEKYRDRMVKRYKKGYEVRQKGLEERVKKHEEYVEHFANLADNLAKEDNITNCTKTLFDKINPFKWFFYK